MARESNAPLFNIKGAMGSMREDETPTEESRMPARKLITETEQPVEGDEPQMKKVGTETCDPRNDSVDNLEGGVAGIVKSATRTVTKEGSVMLGSMPMGDERRRD